MNPFSRYTSRRTRASVHQQGAIASQQGRHGGAGGLPEDRAKRMAEETHQAIRERHSSSPGMHPSPLLHIIGNSKSNLSHEEHDGAMGFSPHSHHMMVGRHQQAPYSGMELPHLSKVSRKRRSGF